MTKPSLNNPSTNSSVHRNPMCNRGCDPMVIQGAIEDCGHSSSGLSEAFDSLSASSLPEIDIAANAAIRANGGAVFGLGAGAGIDEGDALVIPQMRCHAYSCSRYLLKDNSDANANHAAIRNTGVTVEVPPPPPTYTHPRRS